MRIVRLMKLHRLMAPLGEHGSDEGGTDTAVDEVDETGEEVAVGEDADATGSEDDSAVEGDEVVITIGEEAAPAEGEEAAPAPQWVRDLRKQNREKDRRIRELEAKVNAPVAPAVVTLGEKPTLANCDFDESKYEADLETWHAKKREVEDQKRNQEQAEAKSREAWQTKLATYAQASKALKVKDFEDAEDTVKEALSVTQQGIILTGAESSATLIYAIGKNPKKAKELAAITDPVLFAFAVAKLETQLKVTPRRTAPVPERVVRGSATGGPLDSQLEKLRAEADKTGDRSKVSAYIRNKSRAAA